MNKIRAFAFVTTIITLLSSACAQAMDVEQTHLSLRGTWALDLAETKKALLAPNYLKPDHKQGLLPQFMFIGLMGLAFTDAGLEVDSTFGRDKPMLCQLDKATSTPQKLIYRSTTKQDFAFAVTSTGATLLTITDPRLKHDITNGLLYARWTRSTPSSKSPEQRFADYQSGYVTWLRAVGESLMSQPPPPPPNLPFDAKALYNEFINESPNAFNAKKNNYIVVAVRPVATINDTPQTDIAFRREGYGEHIFGLRVLGAFDNSLVGNNGMVFVPLESGYTFPYRQQTAPQIYSADKKCVALSGLSSCPGLVCLPSRHECSMNTLQVEDFNEIEKYANKIQK